MCCVWTLGSKSEAASFRVWISRKLGFLKNGETCEDQTRKNWKIGNGKKVGSRQFPRADFRALDHQLEKENLQQPPLISFEILIIRHFLSLPTRWGYRCSLTSFWHFPPIFVLLKVTCLLVTPFDRKLQVSKVNNCLHF